jgi:eukaryotic-like serine/threonine-protein kinase
VISPGARLGQYEILSALGAGGMGEVYRAKDTKLGRDVAIKVLPELFVADPERVARFQREAKTLAALNHPHIGGIYGLEDAGGVRALVLELVDGPTLADRIAQGSIPLDEALPIARQIAEALEAAHEAGIIHRDLKPANIKLRPDGTVKVLDFGLAKALEPTVPSSASVTASPTITTPAMMTGIGMIVGTAAYMSPEQAKGRPIDKRADLWAFGCVLFEMLTGTRAFAGEDVSDTLAAVLRGEPDWTLLPAAVPLSIHTLIEGCLQKDRKRCIADISAARFLMSEQQVHTIVPPPIAAPRPLWQRALPLAVTAVAGAAVTGLVAWAIGRSESSHSAAPQAVRFEIAAPRGTLFGTRGQTTDPVISPDGSRLVFRALRQGEPVLAVRAIDALDSQILNGTEGASFPFWSPDSRVIAFFAGGKLRTIAAAGGPSQTICDAPPPAFGGTWNRQGLILFAIRAQGIFKVPASGGQPSPVTTLQKEERGHFLPQFLDDGRRFLYQAESNAANPSPTGLPTRSAYISSLDGGPSVRVPGTDFGVRYAPPGYLLFVREDGVLVAQRFDADRARLIGEPAQIGEGLERVGENVSVSSNGVVAYATNPPVNVRLTWVDRAGRSIGSVGSFPFGRYANPELSPEGTQIAVESIPAPLKTAGPGSNQDVWIFDLEHGRSTQLTFDPVSDDHPIWSPDGRRLVFYSRRPRAQGFYEKLASGEKPEELLIQAEERANPWPWDWSSHGIVYDNGGQGDLLLLPLVGVRKPEVLVPKATQGRFSPDGRWLAYSSNDLGRPEVFVKSFPPSDAKWRISTSGLQPRWRRDGKELFYLAADGKLMAVPVTSDGKSFRPDVPRPLFQTGLTGFYPRLRTYGVSPDGQRFLISVSEDPGTSPTIVVLSNWQAALKP